MFIVTEYAALRDVGCYFSFFIQILIEHSANSGDPDQMPHSAASGLGLHYLSTSHKKDARLIWVNQKYVNSKRQLF